MSSVSFSSKIDSQARKRRTASSRSCRRVWSAATRACVTSKGETAPAAAALGKLEVLGGVREFPARVKCATLAWHTLSAALRDQSGIVTTEDNL